MSENCWTEGKSVVFPGTVKNCLEDADNDVCMSAIEATSADKVTALLPGFTSWLLLVTLSWKFTEPSVPVSLPSSATSLTDTGTLSLGLISAPISHVIMFMPFSVACKHEMEEFPSIREKEKAVEKLIMACVP
jgi:hypothetical protein